MKRALVLAVMLACGARSEIAGVISSSSSSDASTNGDSGGCHDEDIAHDAKGASVLAVDGDTVFWASIDGILQRHDASGNATLAATEQTLSSIALDAKNVYATTDQGTIISVPRAGGAITTIAASLGQPFALTIRDDTFYYVNYGAGILAGSVVALGPVEAPTTSTTLIDQIDTPGGLAVDDANVYVSVQEAVVDKIAVGASILSTKRTISPTNTEFPVKLVSAQQTHGLAVDATRVYFVDEEFAPNGSLFAVAKTGGPTTTLAQLSATPFDVFVDSSGAYVNTLGVDASDNLSGALVRVALDGSSAVTIDTLGNNEEVVQARTNATAIYYTIAWPSNLPPAPNVTGGAVTLRKKCK